MWNISSMSIWQQSSCKHCYSLYLNHTATVEKIQPIEIQNAEILAHLQKQRLTAVIQEKQTEEGSLQQRAIPAG